MYTPVEFETIENFSFSDENHRASLKKNYAILLGVISPFKGSKYSEISGFYKFLDLYAQTVVAYSFPSVSCRHKDVDIAIIRENTEGEYRYLRIIKNLCLSKVIIILLKYDSYFLRNNL